MNARHNKQTSRRANCARTSRTRTSRTRQQADRSLTVAARFSPDASLRRGNTIVLVIGILVLLVIIATAFVVRTQAGRVTAGAHELSELRDDTVRDVADGIATEISGALFTRPIDFSLLGAQVDLRVGSNAARLPFPPNALRFEADGQDNVSSAAAAIAPDGRPDYPYNTPSYAVVPYTNWPDPATPIANGTSPGGNGAALNWPAGPGNPTASFSPPSPLVAEYNMVGDPGFNDCRWLRDIEPLRWDTNGDGIPDAFSHWRHLTNIARPDNGWRICRDIADIEGAGIVTDLNIPVEQWLAIPHAYLNSASGNAYLPTAVQFWGQWNRWFTMQGYEQNYRTSAIGPNAIPPNCYKLNDLNGDGIAYNLFVSNPNVSDDAPQMEFVPGTARNIVSRVLADTDGDGYTDSFWFLAPSPLQAGVRTIVAVSIIDNQGMLDANVATRFIRADPTGVPQKSTGLMPVDVALVGQGAATNAGNFNVGFYDTWESWLNIPPEINTAYDTDLVTPGNLWFRHLTEVGLTNAAGAALDFPNTAARLDYWRRSASRPLSSDQQSRYTPFSLSDELELRMFAGQNYPWIVSRYEFSQAANANGSGIGPLRANINREESSEFVDQLVNRIYVADLRHRVTLFNGARNDIAPPWLWLYGPNKDINLPAGVDPLDRDLDGDGVVGDVDDVALFQAGARKFDLRLPYDLSAPGYRVFLPGEWNGAPGYEFTPNTTALQFGMALRDRFANALIDAYDNLPTARGTYYGNTPAALDQTLELCAAYAANVAQWRDRETPAVAGDVTSHEMSRLNEAIPVQASPTNANPTARFMGMEPQPFIVEAFVGHIYADLGVPIPPIDSAGIVYTNVGQHVVVDDDARRSTVIAVQIANPYNRPINLDDPNCQFQVRVFGQEFDLAGLGLGALPPASEDSPATMVLYAIKDDITGDTQLLDKWVDFFDIASTNLTSNSMVVRVPTGRWDIDQRTTYDTNATEPAVDIRRRDPVTMQWVTIDRMDNLTARHFGDAINAMQVNKPADFPGAMPAVYHDPSGDPAGYPYPGTMIGIDGSGYDSWVQWVRATRAWGVDVNNDGAINPNEVNPRYVIGDYAVCGAAGAAADITDPANTGTVLAGGNRYKFNTDAPDLPWFTRPYTREQALPAPAGQNEIVITRKPTFFDFNHIAVAAGISGGDPAYPDWSFPDKGWYAQKASGVGTPDDQVISPPTPQSPQGDRAYRTPFAFQMLQKDDDFEQVGELLNVFLYGHKLQFTNNTATGTFTGETLMTFSEYLSQAQAALTGYEDPQLAYRVNRLLLTPTTNGGTMGQIIGVGDPLFVDDPRHAVPDLPAGVRLLDDFVCDSFGCAPLFDFNGNGSVVDDAENRTVFNAKNFDGSATPGLININTAPLEVLRCLPHMMRLVHETGGTSPGTPFFNASGQPLVTTAPNPNAHDPRVVVPESIIAAREHYNDNGIAAFPNGFIGGPNYEQRPHPRGFSGIGELLTINTDGQAGFLNRATNNGVDTIYPEQWRIDLGVTKNSLQVAATPTAKPFYDAGATPNQQISMRVSTDRQDAWDPFAAVAGNTRPDYVAGDVEEANALFAGVSNLITTRSDVFTVYFRVRTFRQNTSVSPPRWDATNKEYIIDDSRYVMLVDRSGVNKPGDQPKILYMEKLPN